MIRVVVQHAPHLFAIIGLADPADLPAVMQVDGQSFYRCETKNHFALYKAAISGWGHHGFDAAPGQR